MPIRSLLSHVPQHPRAEGRRRRASISPTARWSPTRRVPVRLSAARLRRAARVLRPRGMGAERARAEDAAAGDGDPPSRARSVRSRRARQRHRGAPPPSHFRRRRRRPDRRRAGRRDRRNESLHAGARFQQHRSAADARHAGRSRPAHSADVRSTKLAARAMRDLESLGVQVWTGAQVTDVIADGVVDRQRADRGIDGAVGSRCARCRRRAHARRAELDQAGRVIVGPDLTIAGHPEVFVLGDMSRRAERDGKPLPGVALVAMQEGIYVADLDQAGSRRHERCRRRAPFRVSRPRARWRRSAAAARSPSSAGCA